MIAEGWRVRSAQPSPRNRSHALVAESRMVSGEGASLMWSGAPPSGCSGDPLREVYEQLHQPLRGLDLRAVPAVLDDLEGAVRNGVEHAICAGLEHHQVVAPPHELNRAADALEPE